jgi:hypothetical protein
MFLQYIGFNGLSAIADTPPPHQSVKWRAYSNVLPAQVQIVSANDSARVCQWLCTCLSMTVRVCQWLCTCLSMTVAVSHWKRNTGGQGVEEDIWNYEKGSVTGGRGKLPNRLSCLNSSLRNGRVIRSRITAMGRECSLTDTSTIAYKMLVEKTEWKRPLGSCTSR